MRDFTVKKVDVARQVKAIEAFEATAVKSAQDTKGVVERELKDLERTLGNIEGARAFEDLTVVCRGCSMPRLGWVECGQRADHCVYRTRSWRHNPKSRSVLRRWYPGTGGCHRATRFVTQLDLTGPERSLTHLAGEIRRLGRHLSEEDWRGGERSVTLLHRLLCPVETHLHTLPCSSDVMCDVRSSLLLLDLLMQSFSIDCLHSIGPGRVARLTNVCLVPLFATFPGSSYVLNSNKDHGRRAQALSQFSISHLAQVPFRAHVSRLHGPFTILNAPPNVLWPAQYCDST